MVVLGCDFGPSSNESVIRTTEGYGRCGLTVDSTELKDDNSKSCIRVYGGVNISWPSIMGFIGRCQFRNGDTWIGGVNSNMVTDCRLWANRFIGGNIGSSGTVVGEGKLKCQYNCSECTFVSNIFDMDNDMNHGIVTQGNATNFIEGRFSPNPAGNNLFAHNTIHDPDIDPVQSGVQVTSRFAFLVNPQEDRPDGFLGNLWLNNLHSTPTERNAQYLKIGGTNNIQRFDRNVFALEAGVAGGITAPGGNNPISIPDGTSASPPIVNTTVDGNPDSLNTQAWATGNLALTVTQTSLSTSFFPSLAGSAIEVGATNGVHFDYYGQTVPRTGGNDAPAGAVNSEPI